MGLSFAAVWSVLSKKRRKSKLKVFKEKLEKDHKQQAILHQYPTKLLFSLLFLLLVSIYLEWFLLELVQQLTEKAKNQTENSLGYIHSLGQISSDKFQENYKEINEVNSYSNTNQIIQRTSRSINIIHLLIYIAIASIIYHLSYTRVIARKGQSRISRATYELVGLKKKVEQYTVKEGDRLQIWEMGQTRFTYTNYYYSIRIIGENESWQIIRKSNIYFSRTSIVELGFVLNLPYSIKILKVLSDHQQQL